MTRPTPEPHTLAGAYVLDAVSERDRAHFERHLARCAACAREVVELREAATGLARAAAAEPSPALILRVLESASQIRQLPPATDEAITSMVGLAARAGTGHIPGPRTLSRLAGALAVVLVAAGAILGVVAHEAYNEVSAAQHRAHQIASVLNAPDAIMLTGLVKNGGTATVVMSDHDRALVFTTAGLRRLPASRCYQLWLMGKAGDRSAGMLPPPHDGRTDPVIASGLRAGDRVGMTIEPDGGTSRPTGPLILLIPL